jgi:ApaG protein
MASRLLTGRIRCPSHPYSASSTWNASPRRSTASVLYRALQRSLRDYAREWTRVESSRSVLQSAFHAREWSIFCGTLGPALNELARVVPGKAPRDPRQLAAALRRSVRERSFTEQQPSERELELGFGLLRVLQSRVVALKRLVYEPHSSCLTAGVRVQVDSLFLGREQRGVGLDGLRDMYHFTYFVRIENHGPAPVLLLGRHWDINDLEGQLQTVRGLGVVGQTPTLQVGDSYEYRSQCVLAAPLGVMRGFYRMFQMPKGDEVAVEIKPFGLIASTLHKEPQEEQVPADGSVQTASSYARRARVHPARPPL